MLILVFVLLYLYHVYKTKTVISRKTTGVYLIRYYLIPSNKYFNIYLHKFMSSDEDIALHDHPWDSLSILLYNSYIECIPENKEKWLNNESRSIIEIERKQFSVIYRDASWIHKIVLHKGPVYTLFITSSYKRNWFFWCDKGPVLSSDFLDKTGTEVGKGCD